MNYVLRAVFFTCTVILLCSCSTRNDKASNINPRTGKHPAGWVVATTGGTHTTAFINGPSSCYECHGKDLSGGISKVSCFSAARSGMTCHANGPSGHPAGWSAATSHGVHAKNSATGVNGFIHCQICHGSDFAGGTANKTCLNTTGCHGAGVYAPHPGKPWLSTLGGSTHSNTDASNAPVCALCHTGGANSDRMPSPLAPAGTAPGCFNNTLCHGVEGHDAGWNLPANHGAAAKAAAGGDKGFGACVVCHGANFAGGTAQQSCLNATGCHGAGVNAPHPGAPWRSSTGGFTHATTDTSNAAQCAVCHTGGNNSSRQPNPGDPVGISGCFNNTLCHGSIGHASGWSAANVHGAEAKKAPSGSTGFSSCQSCHGVTFSGGTATTCLNNAACHGSGVNSPHAGKPWFSTVAGQPTHSTTDPGNAGICAACHTAGANSTLGNTNAVTGTAGCFNNTLCHFHQIPFAPSATIPASLHGGEAKKNLSTCQGCHGTKGTTSFDGATLSDGTKTIACSSCHTFAKAHPTDWQGSGSYSHRTATNVNVACIICHNVSSAGAGPLAGAPGCFSTTFTNGAGQTRTCHASGPGVAPHAVPYNNHIAVAGGSASNATYCLGCHQISADSTTAGGTVIPGCLTCHYTDPTASGLVQCTSCHGNPPSANLYPNIAGTHASHKNAGKVTVMSLVCADCHTGLGLTTVDHQVRAKARTATGRANPVVFSNAALIVAGGGTASAFNDATGQCANVYCHGAKMPSGDTSGSNRTPVWGSTLLPATISAAACGTCHGFPPAGHSVTIPAGFPATPLGTTCSCHANINTQTATAATYANVFIDLTKHINGSLEISGGASHSFPNPGSLHKTSSNGTGCLGCHALGTGASVYPVSTGVAPDCRSCHLNANPGSDPQCSDCHGSVANNGAGALLAGRPTGGATFPNRPGEHNRSQHIGRACTVCHPFTSGDSRHGWSNRQRSTAAQVGGAGTSINSWNATTKSCTPTCHGPETW